MPLSETALANKRKYTAEYKKSHLKRFTIELQIEKYDEIKRASDEAGETITGYIKKAIDERIATGK